MIDFLVYATTVVFVIGVLYGYIRMGQKSSAAVRKKVNEAKELGMFEPVSLHPHINLSACMGSGACVSACPEKDIIGIVDGKATIINATSCIGHGACFLACPVDAITLRIGTAERGVELPHVMPNYQSNVPGIFISGELGGMGLIKNAAEQGIQAAEGIRQYLTKQKPMPEFCDLLIVGAGPSGIAAVLRARELDLKVRIVDQESLGGTVFSFPRQKVVMTQPMELPGYGKVKLVNTTKQELLDIWQTALAKFKIEVEEHKKVTSILRGENHFTVEVSEQESICARAVLLAIGRRGSPRKLGVLGENLDKVTYKLIEPELFKDLNVLVVGGGDSAIESALLLAENNNVTISYRQGNFARIKPDNRIRIQHALEMGILKVKFNSIVKLIERETVSLLVDKDEIILQNDHVFVFAGGELPNAFLKSSGVEIETHFGKTVRKHRA